MNRNTFDLPPYPLQRIIAPLERLALPAHLDGSMLPRGSSLSGCPIEACNDLEALQMWLAEVAKSKASFRSYRLEAERCLLWATAERGKPLTALNNEDIRDYAQFMLDPAPRASWLSERGVRREDENWRPFRGPLSPRSRDRALGIISSLFEWLVTSGYLPKNPWNSPPLKSRSIDKERMAPATVMEKRACIASLIEWSYVRKVLDEFETSSDMFTNLRTRAILFLAYFADMKPAEIASLHTSSIRILSSGPMPIWHLDIAGRPPNLREIFLLPPVQSALEHYLASRGITLDNSALEAGGPVIVSSRDTQGWTEIEANLSRHSVQRSTREVFQLAAKLAQFGGDKAAARRLSVATVHWLRHAFEVHAMQRHTRRHWCWQLLGAYWLAPPSSKRYLPERTKLSSEMALVAFEELRDVWQNAPH